MQILRQDSYNIRFYGLQNYFFGEKSKRAIRSVSDPEVARNEQLVSNVLLIQAIFLLRLYIIEVTSERARHICKLIMRCDSAS